MQIIARVQYRGASVGKAGMVMQALRQKLPCIAKAETGIGDKGVAIGIEQLRHHRTLHRVDNMRAFKHLVGGIANHLCGVDLIIMVQHACVITPRAARHKVAVVRPLAAQHWAIARKEIRSRYRRGQENIIVEIQEMFGKAGDTPQHRFNRQRIECR